MKRLNELRERKEVIVLTNLLAFLLGVIFLLLSKYCLRRAPWGVLFNLLGAYLTISVVVNLFHKAFIKPSEDEDRRKKLEKLLDERINDILGKSIKYGFAGIMPKMDFNNLFDDLSAGDELWWLDTYAPGHELWQDNLKAAIVRGVHVRMLVMSQESPNAVHRANEIGGTYTPERFKKELQGFKDALEIIQRETEREIGRLEIAEYVDLPGLPLYIVTRKSKPIYACCSFFLGKPTAVSFPHMKWRVGECNVLQMLYDYIENKWEKNWTRS